MPVRLVPANSGKPIVLDKPVLLIGRNPDCDVDLKGNRKVSRLHCLVVVVQNRVIIRDLGSTNGVWINGQRVDREGRMKIGDELSVADFSYHLRKIDDDGHDDRGPIPKQSQRSSDPEQVPRRRVKPLELAPGQEDPIPIPEEDDSFVVEQSMPRLPKVRGDDRPSAKQTASARRHLDDSDADLATRKRRPAPRDDDSSIDDHSEDVIALHRPGDSADGLPDVDDIDDQEDSDDVIPLAPVDDD